VEKDDLSVGAKLELHWRLCVMCGDLARPRWCNGEGSVSPWVFRRQCNSSNHFHFTCPNCGYLWTEEINEF
jgi:hypothetical protein